MAGSSPVLLFDDSVGIAERAAAADVVDGAVVWTAVALMFLCW